jgi:Family of unknown function (DUF5908)
MPIQIRELIITANVEDRQAAAAESKAPDTAKLGTSQHEREEMVQQCVDEVLKVLKHKTRR